MEYGLTKEQIDAIILDTIPPNLTTALCLWIQIIGYAKPINPLRIFFCAIRIDEQTGDEISDSIFYTKMRKGRFSGVIHMDAI